MLPPYVMHNGQNDMSLVYEALGDSADLNKDMIFNLRVVVDLNMCVEL